MGPFLLSVVRTFPWCLAGGGLIWALLAVFGDLRGVDGIGQLYMLLLGASGLAVFIGGGRGLRAQYAGRVRPAEAAFRADRLDLGLLSFLLGTMLALGAGYLATPQGGESLLVVGGLLGVWLVSSSPFSLVLILLVLAWTGGVGMVALTVHQQSLLEVWKLLAASLGLLLCAGLLRRLLAMDGPPGWLRTFLTFTTVVVVPFGWGLLAPPHDFSKRGSSPGPDETAFWILTFFGVFLAYQWLCLARPGPGGRPAEATDGGCGCAFMGFGVLMLGLDQAGGALLFLPLAVRVALVVLATLACAAAARSSTSTVREKYRRAQHGS